MPNTDDKNLMRVAQYLKTEQLGHKRSIPPLHEWQPKHCGKMNLLIKSNGEWWHEGQLIRRQALLDLFSSVLWKEQEKYYLKTPVEQIEITVEDVPLLVTEADQIELDGQTYIQLKTRHGDVVIVNAEHPIEMREYGGELRPYVHVRFGLDALIQRSAFYHLVNMGEMSENAQGQIILSLRSGDLHLHLHS
ncbi:DUF1285 domain-containing protein [Acinetobacter rudis]|uniref:DUF1285 domain-containing protein n=1 Tax=Acinetobacter rudis TaxID=632955 RepID=A0AAW8J7V4_9GAMM|nr:DUF1285 domain-containing protein [Acinetobacter rudis]MDQ8935261.1 DUF1285 domain-containing protein [Acinetobacter rudis]MDQ8952724.1 DUF1285 domain-containing protein [Acinetobacter rudis]MDQ9017544.1 DUF1285 domain-containing protein [Acinetobacter rudis]